VRRFGEPADDAVAAVRRSSVITRQKLACLGSACAAARTACRSGASRAADVDHDARRSRRGAWCVWFRPLILRLRGCWPQAGCVAFGWAADSEPVGLFEQFGLAADGTEDRGPAPRTPAGGGDLLESRLAASRVLRNRRPASKSGRSRAGSASAFLAPKPRVRRNVWTCRPH